MPAKNPETKTERLDPSPYVRILQMIDNKYPASERGDMLIFMSGMSEIQIVVEAVKAYAENKQRWIVVPLHSALSIAEQDKVFDVAPEGARKCVVSTNIAETSVTIDGIRFVVDSGKAKEMNYFSQFKMQRLQEFWVSKASAEQRKGRAGRTGPGICYRLYTEQDYEAFDDYTMPEIHKVPLDSLVLQMIAMGLSDVRTFSFIEAPSSASIEYAVQSLKEHGALTQSEKLTPIGQMLGKLPVEVVLGKMLIMGCIFNIVEPVTTMAAALAIQSPFTNYAYRDPDVLLARKNLESSHGDSFTLLNCFNEWLQLKAGRGTSSRRWCKTRGLEEQRFYEITKLRQQFRQLLSSHGLLEKKPDLQTSTERRQYYGEVQRLKRMKREYHSAAPRKRKVLKRESNHEIEGFHGHSSDEEKAVDIRDIDFHLAHSSSTLREEVEATQLTHKHVILLKLILSSGLYPQLAIVDENNSFRPNTDQVFHTKDKPFVVLHPVGVFASDPELLQLKDLDVMSSEESKDTQQVQTSAKHQLLTYVTLMESKNKPYIINTTRVPALQTLLLFAHALDTSADLQRVVADGWLEVTFIDTDQAHGTISGVIQIRRAWAELVEKRLSDISGKHTEVPAMSETKLERRLQALMYTEIPYKLRRVLAAERQHMYLGSRAGELSTGENPFSPGEQCELDAVKGGLQVTDYLTYGCLDCSSHSTAFLSSVWTCPSCECKMVVSELQRLQHENSCGMTEGEASKVEEEEEEEDDGPVNPLKKSYYCEPCNKNFKFTSVEILKHKKQHAQ
ncbi:PREDICTED: probable ATP-dependent RNA helicase DHX34 isoform X2 [Priapulus caudatus]|nr:PREDICTED: probable ATP-dependent RNA helicase DHX34 isoform X2 [Priapulus caudatus]